MLNLVVRKVTARLWKVNGYQGSFLDAKRPSREVNHSPRCSAEVKNDWSCTATRLSAFILWTRETTPLPLPFILWRRAPQQTLRTHRSLKSYCATLWWRRLVFFSFFRVMEYRWNEIDRGKTEVPVGKPVPVPLCPPQIPHGLSWDRNRVPSPRLFHSL
jgi:hypothetical protein